MESSRTPLKSFVLRRSGSAELVMYESRLGQPMVGIAPGAMKPSESNHRSIANISHLGAVGSGPS